MMMMMIKRTISTTITVHFWGMKKTKTQNTNQ